MNTEAIERGLDCVRRFNAGHGPAVGPVTGPALPPTATDDLLPQLRRSWRARRPAGVGQPLLENLFLVAALRASGAEVSLVLGREVAPPARQARYLSWVESAGRCLSTGAPVAETYLRLLELPRPGDVGRPGAAQRSMSPRAG